MKIAVFSDIHGNLKALETVLERIKAQNADLTVFLGDIFQRGNEEFECLDLLKNSDIITVHTPLTDKTKGLIDGKAIEMMKDGVVLVNEARGAVTDENAVADGVISGKIGAFGCDVYSAEPMSENHPFNKILNMDNVCLTPHMAWGALESRQRCVDEIAENIRAFKKGEKRNRIV